MTNRRNILTALVAIALATPLTGCADRAPNRVRSPAADFAAPTTLPSPVTDGPLSLEQALQRRRSIRAFRPDPVPLAMMGQLLWAGQGITSADGKRAAPSAGALYPVELYVVTADRLLHYLPDGHRVETRETPDLRPGLRDAALGQEAVTAAPMVMVVAAVIERTRRKYGTRAEAFVDREVGHVAENIMLEATARGLGSVPIGAVDPERAAAVLGLPSNQAVHYLMPVGVPA